MHMMHVSEDQMKAKLRNEDPNFAELERAHRKLDEALMLFELHVYLSPEDEHVRRDMQKQKLAVKDQMEAMMRKRAAMLN